MPAANQVPPVLRINRTGLSQTNGGRGETTPSIRKSPYSRSCFVRSGDVSSGHAFWPRRRVGLTTRRRAGHRTGRWGSGTRRGGTARLGCGRPVLQASAWQVEAEVVSEKRPACAACRRGTVGCGPASLLTQAGADAISRRHRALRLGLEPPADPKGIAGHPAGIG